VRPLFILRIKIDFFQAVLWNIRMGRELFVRPAQFILDFSLIENRFRPHGSEDISAAICSHLKISREDLLRK